MCHSMGLTRIGASRAARRMAAVEMTGRSRGLCLNSETIRYTDDVSQTFPAAWDDPTRNAR